MANKTVVIEKAYSKADLDRLKLVGKKIEDLQKKPGFKKAVKEFIKLTT